jgi:hypothetical protein
MITETQSSGFDLRDAFYNAVLPGFTGYTARKTRMLPVQPLLIPYLGVYLVDETMTPDGDANAGMIRFAHSIRIGFSVIITNNDQNAAEQTVDQAFLKILQLLYCDQHVMNVLHNNNPEGVGTEGIMRGIRRHNFGNAGARNETPFVELQYDVSAYFRSEWYPDITDMLDEIDVITGIKITDTQAERDQRQQVEWAWDFTTGAPPITKPTFNTAVREARAPLRYPWRSARDQGKVRNNG